MQLRRVFVTGYGAISPFGRGVDRLYNSLAENRTGIVNMRTEWEKEVEDLSCWVGGALQEELPLKEIPRKYRKSMGKTAIMSYFAAQEAIEMSGLGDSELQNGRMGICFGSTTGSVESTEKFLRIEIEHKSARKLNSGIFFQIMSHTSAANLAQCFNIKGRVISPNCACSSSAQSIGLGFESIGSGQQDIMLCGGSDELHVMTTASFDIVQASSFGYNSSPGMTPRPFDQHRDGTVCSDGAGCLILESEESARARGVPILGEIVGFHTSSSGSHIAHSDINSISECIKEALASAGLRIDEIDYINAHATGTNVGDHNEALALKKVLAGRQIPVSSFKGSLGHTLGASGVLEVISCLKMIDNDLVIGTRNLEDIDNDCRGLNHITQTQKAEIRYFIKNSFAFGGINSVLVLRR